MSIIESKYTNSQTITITLASLTTATFATSSAIDNSTVAGLITGLIASFEHFLNDPSAPNPPTGTNL